MSKYAPDLGPCTCLTSRVKLNGAFPERSIYQILALKIVKTIPKGGDDLNFRRMSPQGDVLTGLPVGCLPVTRTFYDGTSDRFSGITVSQRGVFHQNVFGHSISPTQKIERSSMFPFFIVRSGVRHNAGQCLYRTPRGEVGAPVFGRRVTSISFHLISVFVCSLINHSQAH